MYHSNYPDGKDFQYKVVYNIQSYTSTYNAFDVLKTHEECGFTVPNIYALADKYWNEKRDGTGYGYRGGGLFTFYESMKNTETHLYAQYVPKADELIYTLTYMNGSEMFRKGEYDPNTVVDITPDVPTQAASQNLSTARSGEKEFLGWDDSEEATTVDYEFGDTILIDQDKILYAVWGEKGPNKPDKPTEPELKVLLEGKIKVKDVYPLTEARHEDKTYGLLEDKEPLDNYLQQQAYADKDSQILYQYMDLVDKSNGNAQVTSTQPMAIYWKLPKNADPDKEITLVHFEGLDRDYSGADLEGELAKANVQVFSTTPDQEAGEEALTKETIHGETYLKFTVSTFSPFALIWQNKQGGNPDPTYYYKLHYEPNGGTVYQDEWYTYNTLVQLTKVPSREGYTFTGWYADKDLTQKITDVRMTSHKTVYAGWRATNVPDWLNGTDHFAYVVGYPDGNVKPMANISRAEVATIFFRLLKEEVRDANLTTTNNFEDVNEGYWCNTAVSTMAKLGIIEGRTATTFDPEAPITRAEFAAICARFETSKVEGGNSFTDIAGHWAEEEIKRAAALGWILGYEDDTFRPENKITRAEAMTMFNRVLNRLPEEESDLLEGMRVWPDNQPGTWYYLAVQEATNSHNYKHKGEIYETWTELTEDPDWSQYE